MHLIVAEVLDTPNLEAQHHLLVARLHREVYSQPLDVAKILGQIILDERTEEKDWKGSQITESAVGTPKKASSSLSYLPSSVIAYCLYPPTIYFQAGEKTSPASSSSNCWRFHSRYFHRLYS